MIIKDGIRSLKNNLAKAMFYWFTFVMTSMFIFLFFNISMSESLGFTWINNNNDTVTTITVFVIAICLIIIFFANDFFIKNKARDLAVRLVCGATFLQLAGYLLVQTFILLAAAIPVGIVGAILLVPMINSIISTILQSSFVIGIHSQAVLTTTVILVAVVFWTTYLNLGFAYRNTAAMLLNERKVVNPLSGVDFTSMDGAIFLTEAEKKERLEQRARRKQARKKYMKGLSLILAIGPVIMYYFNRDMIIPLSIFGMIGVHLSLKHVIIPFISRQAVGKRISDPLDLAFLGFFRNDLQILKNNVILFVSCGVMLVAILLARKTTDLEMMLSLLSYIVMNVLLAMAIMFKFSTEVYSRRKYYRTLDQIGYTPEAQKKIILKEVSALYASVLAIAGFYLINIFISLILQGVMTLNSALVLVVFMAAPMLVCYLVTLSYYRITVLSR